MKILLALIAALGLTGCGYQSTIGGHPVPFGLHCQEDETIHFVQEGEAPYDLGCVHIDTFRTEISSDGPHER